MAPTWPIPSFNVVAPPPPPPPLDPANIIVLSDDEDDDIQAAVSSSQQTPPPPPSLVLGSSSSSTAANSSTTTAVVYIDSDSDDIEEEDEEVQEQEDEVQQEDEEVHQEQEEEEEVQVVRKMLRAPCYQRWSFSDEVNILRELGRIRRDYGFVPKVSKHFLKAMKDKGLLKREDATLYDVNKKVSNLKKRFEEDKQNFGGPRNGRQRNEQKRNQRLYELSSQVWRP